MTTDWSEFIPPGKEPEAVELAGKWKHGWIPLDPTATSSKMKGRTGGKKWWSGKSSGGGARRVAGGGRKKASSPQDEMHARMSRQKPESTKTIMARNKRMGPMTDYDRGGRATGGEISRNPSDEDYFGGMGLNTDGSPKRKAKLKKDTARDDYFSGMGVKESERPDESEDMGDEEYFAAMGMNPDGSLKSTSKKTAPSHFRGSQKGMTIARMKYNANQPDTISATKHFGAGHTWRKGSDGKYTLYKGDKPVLDRHGAKTTSTRERLASALKGQISRPESRESRRVHDKNYLREQIASGNAPMNSGKRNKLKMIDAQQKAEEHKKWTGGSGSLDRYETERLKTLRSKKRNGALTEREQQQFDALAGRFKQHGRIEYVMNVSKGEMVPSGKTIGGSRKGKA